MERRKQQTAAPASILEVKTKDSWQISSTLALLSPRASCNPRPLAVNYLGQYLSDFCTTDVVITLQHGVASTMMFLHAEAPADVIKSSRNVSLQRAPDDEDSNSGCLCGLSSSFLVPQWRCAQANATEPPKPPTELSYGK